MSADNASLGDWIGRARVVEDFVTPRLVESFRATLAPHLAPLDGAVAPLGLHWCLAPDIVETARLNTDGHPARGDFLPPVPLPRRMWASGEVEFLAPLRSGDRVRRHSRIEEIAEKDGKSGPLCFVTLHHDLETVNGPVIRERQVIVYRGPGQPASQAAHAATAEVPDAEHVWPIAVDPVLLFRYSALTFNGHRIHYDAPYATEEEHYPGLVIHGPLQATFLMNLASAVGGTPRRFAFRGVAPATGTQILRAYATKVQAGNMDLRIVAEDGVKTMMATAQW